MSKTCVLFKLLSLPVQRATEFGYNRKDVLLIGGGLIGAGFGLYYGLQATGMDAGMAGNWAQVGSGGGCAQPTCSGVAALPSCEASGLDLAAPQRYRLRPLLLPAGSLLHSWIAAL